jgi:hypothetical protein
MPTTSIARPERQDTAGEVNWRRGLVRLAIGLTLWWFLFWTCAYAISPPSENAPPAAAALSLTTEIVLAAIGVANLWWVAAGFRSG